MDDKIQLAPRFGDTVEQRFHLARHARVERHDNPGLKLLGQRLDEFFGFVVEICHREFSAERTKRLGATPSD
jgi:hypothetical protein